jgi:hypothetical protein
MIFPELTLSPPTEDISPLSPPVSDDHDRYKLDWTLCDAYKKLCDAYKKQSKRKWWGNYKLPNFKLDKSQLEAFEEAFEDCNWKEFNYPPRYEHVYEKYEYIWMTPNYYTEIKHFEALAISEWDRGRSFDTSVREHCLCCAIKAVDLYFFLLIDACRFRTDMEKMISPLWKYRFWKHQTGSGLIVDRAFSEVYSLDKALPCMVTLYNDLEENSSSKLFDQESLSFYEGQKEGEDVLDIIRPYMRRSKIQKLGL